MAKWKATVDFSSFWDDDISIQEKGKLASVELNKLMNAKWLSDYDKYELEEIIEGFEWCTGDGEPPETTEFTPIEDFNARMEDLYDWADCYKVWIKTFF